MWSAVGFFQVLFLSVPSMGANHNPPIHEILCLNQTCFKDEACVISNIENQLHGHCIQHTHVHQDCGHQLMNSDTCICMHQACVHNVVALHCGTHLCKPEEVCNFHVNNNRQLQAECKKLTDMQHHDVLVCLDENIFHQHGCYCMNAFCNQQVYNLVHGQQTQDKTISEPTREASSTILQSSVPTTQIRSQSSSIATSTAIMNNKTTSRPAFQCGDKTCEGNQFCLLTEDYLTLNVTFICSQHAPLPDIPYCLPNRLTPNHTCYCESRKCVDTAIIYIMQVVDNIKTEPTTQASTTIQLSSVPTVQISTSSTVVPTKNSPTLGQQMVASPPSTMITESPDCIDVEDSLFSCLSYERSYGMCAATSVTLITIANKRCQKFCKICTGTRTTHETYTPQSASLVPPVCVDHDSRCGIFKNHVCSSDDSQQFFIANCALTCGKCAEYFASLSGPTPTPEPTSTQGPTSTPAAPVKCHVCGDIDNRIPCYNKEVQNSNPSSSVVCPAGQSFCMTDVFQDNNGNVEVYKRCITRDVCDRKWISESADLDYCARYGMVHNPSAHECHFCCQGDHCNTEIQPQVATLVAKATGKRNFE